MKTNNKVFTRERQMLYLAELARTDAINASARASGVCGETVRRAREDPEFAEAEQVARQVFREKLEAEAIRRASEGWDEPVFQGGVEVGVKHRYSDRLLELILKAKLPEYRERAAVDLNVTNGVLIIPATPATSVEWEELHREGKLVEIDKPRQLETG